MQTALHTSNAWFSHHSKEIELAFTASLQCILPAVVETSCSFRKLCLCSCTACRRRSFFASIVGYYFARLQLTADENASGYLRGRGCLRVTSCCQCWRGYPLGTQTKQAQCPAGCNTLLVHTSCVDHRDRHTKVVHLLVCSTNLMSQCSCGSRKLGHTTILRRCTRIMHCRSASRVRPSSRRPASVA